MPIQEVFIKSSAYLTCLSHALSTEKEEIMGLLLGRLRASSYLEIFYFTFFVQVMWSPIVILLVERKIQLDNRLLKVLSSSKEVFGKNLY